MKGYLQVLLALVILTLGSATGFAAEQTIPLGVARIDITPDHPARLAGYSVRQTESEGVAERIWAKALAIGGDEGDGPAVLMMVENCGVPGSLAAEVAGRLQAKAVLRRERFVVCSTHAHSAPWLPGFAPALSSAPVPSEHLAHMEQYKRELARKMEQVALAALAARKPGRLAWAEGAARFAVNRRPIDKTGHCPGLGLNLGGPVDDSLPLLCATDAQGKILAIVVNYACHCTTVSSDVNRIHGDWAGMAQKYIEAEHPGATALVCIGCGGDANPWPRAKLELTAVHGREVADEVNRLLRGKLTPLGPKLAARRLDFQVPFETLPTREEFQRRVAAAAKPKATWLEKQQGVRAVAFLAALDRGQPLPTNIDYSATAWAFGDELAMVFLSGEVVVDYALRLKRELDSPRLWVTAYSNGVPCYIPSRRVLSEGGYEPDFSMLYYGWPARLSPVVEERVVKAAESLVPASFVGARKKSAAAAGWKAGVATVKITPETSLWMAGYAARTRPSEGAAQDLFAKALAIEDAHGSRAVIVTMDLIGIDRALRDWVEQQVRAKYGLPRSGLLLNVSHTHCGPALNVEDLDFRKIDPALVAAAGKYRAGLQKKLVELVGAAIARLAPAQLDYFHARCGFAMNRRRPTPNGYQNAPNSEGPVDHAVPVLRVRDATGTLRAVLFGYACHNTCMGDYLFRGDYAGYAQEYLEQAHPGMTAMFCIGCAGDQNPYPRHDPEFVRMHGRTLATTVDAALETVPKPLAGPLRTALDDVTLEFAAPSSREELQAIAATKKRPAADHAQRLLKQLNEKGEIPINYSYPVQVVRFGDDLVLVALAGETVVDYSLRLKRELAGPAVWVAGYSNDVFGYVPSLRVLKEGGYEAGDAMLWGAQPGPFAPSVEERIVAKVHQLSKQTVP
jgi:hypothetical protein